MKILEYEGLASAERQSTNRSEAIHADSEVATLFEAPGRQDARQSSPERALASADQRREQEEPNPWSEIEVSLCSEPTPVLSFPFSLLRPLSDVSAGCTSP